VPRPRRCGLGRLAGSAAYPGWVRCARGGQSGCESGEQDVEAAFEFGRANAVSLPLGRFHVAALTRDDDWVTMPTSMVQELNRWQILQAKTHVHFHPGSGLQSFVLSIRPERVAAISSEQEQDRELDKTPGKGA
jgi:hypothetical protein